MMKILAIQGSSLKKVSIKTDTTILLAAEAQKRGYKIYYFEPENLSFLNGKVKTNNFQPARIVVVPVPSLISWAFSTPARMCFGLRVVIRLAVDSIFALCLDCAAPCCDFFANDATSASH